MHSDRRDRVHCMGQRSFGKLYDRVSCSDYEKSREGNSYLYTMQDISPCFKETEKQDRDMRSFPPRGEESIVLILKIIVASNLNIF